ncbi:MAG: mechanosensitive ion channel family protein [Gemmatimonadota bacterium]
MLPTGMPGRIGLLREVPRPELLIPATVWLLVVGLPTQGLAVSHSLGGAGTSAQVVDTILDPEETAPLEASEMEAALQARAPLLELLAIYRRMDGLRDVRMHLDGGILELTGTALTREDRDRAGALALEVDGIRYVDNRIGVEESLAARWDPTIERFEEKGLAFIRFLPVFVVGLLILGLTIFVAYWAGRPAFPYTRLVASSFAADTLRLLVRFAIVLVGTLLALDLMGAGALVGAVLGTAGLAGLALGFAFRDIAENYLAGILLSLRQPFMPRDHIEIGGHEGLVVRLTGRETVLMTLDGNHVRIPNTTVFKGILTNYSRNPRRRFLVHVDVAPTEDLTRALTLGKEILSELPEVLDSPPVAARVIQLGASSVELHFHGWVDQSATDFGKAHSRALRLVKEGFATAGIETPPPEYGVRILGASSDDPAQAADSSKGGQETRTEKAPKSVQPSEDADLSPDTTIEEEIERELRESPEENLLSPPSRVAGGLKAT